VSSQAEDPLSTIYHFTPQATWCEAELAGRYEGDTLQLDGFIHCSTRAQVADIADIVFPGRTDLVLLRIDAEFVHADVRYESRHPGGGRLPAHPRPAEPGCGCCRGPVSIRANRPV
jgi:uncharacterized protein (DUF952 family)